MKKSWFTLAFLVVSIAHVAAIAGGWSALADYTKPFILLTLTGYYLSQTSARSVIFVLALSFSCGGDLLLLFQPRSETFFMFGLGSFLMAHVFYIFSYWQYCFTNARSEALGTQKVRLAFPVVLAGTGLVIVLFPSLGNLKVPVVLYAMVLTGMVVTSVFRLGRTSPSSFWMVFCGAVLFMISDSLLAIDKFYNPVAHASLWIMITYCLAQFLIVEGILRHPASD